MKDLVGSSPSLQDWREMSKEQRSNSAYFIGGVTMTGIIALMGFYEADAKFLAEISVGGAGGVLTTDAALRVKRFLAVLKLVQVTENKFSAKEKEVIKDAMKNNEDNLKQIDQLIASKYSPEEFNQILEIHILPLFEDYRKKVIV